MMDFLRLNDQEYKFIWDSIQREQVIFHPEIAPYGKFNYDSFFEELDNTDYILFLDRNILSSLIKLCKNGFLQSKAESQRVGLIMIWAIINNIQISAGLAVQEQATKTKSQHNGLVELKQFLEIFDFYPVEIWKKVALGQITKIPKLPFSMQEAKEITVDYDSGNDSYFMMLSSIIHALTVYLDPSTKPVEKLQLCLQWTYDNLLLCQYLIAYLILLFTNQEGIKAPKGARSGDFEKIIKGCENEAWDLAYLANGSQLTYHFKKTGKDFLFCTHDIMLKRIFINTHGPDGVNGLLFEAFTNQDAIKIIDFMNEQNKNRIKPNFGDNPEKYFQDLVNKEKLGLKTLISN